MDSLELAIVIGIGELGAVFARGLLRVGVPVFPVTRSVRLDGWLARGIDPSLVVVCVGENEIDAVLSGVPATLRDRVTLVQNELLPDVWQRHSVMPSVVVVWFEKKRGQDVKVVLPTVVFGRHAPLLCRALDELTIPNRSITSSDDLVFELVAKNLYILVTNIAGLQTRGTVAELWNAHRETALAVAADVLAVQERRAGRKLDRKSLIAVFERAVFADPEHACTGRSAPARLARALEQAHAFGIETPALERIARGEAVQ